MTPDPDAQSSSSADRGYRSIAKILEKDEEVNILKKKKKRQFEVVNTILYSYNTDSTRLDLTPTPTWVVNDSIQCISSGPME